MDAPAAEDKAAAEKPEKKADEADKKEPKPKKAAKKDTDKAKKPAKEKKADEGGFKGLKKPDGDPDDLKKISGVGPVLEKKLNDFGIYHYSQIAGLKKAEIAEIDDALNFKGRIERDDWLKQAKALMKESG